MTTPTASQAPADRSPALADSLVDSLVTDHSKALVAYASKLLGDHHLAEDIVQEALIRAWPHTERLSSTQGSVRGWLLTVTRNLVIDRLRSPSSRYETVDAATDETPQRDHSEAVLAAVESARLLDQLSAEHRDVLVHTYLRGLTVEETARTLGVPAGTVKSRQHYALRKLRERFRLTG
jgi:RNA polymerase sigma-70 factor (ECF subfamily)